MSITITPDCLRAIFEINAVPPMARFEAAAGRDHGRVAVWPLGNDWFLVEWGDNGTTQYCFSQDVDPDDLAPWIIYDVDGLDKIVLTANIRGAEAVQEADENDPGPYYILVTSYFYGPREESKIIMSDDQRTPLAFETLAEAQKWIESTDDGSTHILSHNESSRPTYKIVACQD